MRDKLKRNDCIREYLFKNPIDRNLQNCYQEVCDMFNVNKDVIKGIIRHYKGDKVLVKNSNNEIETSSISKSMSTNYSTGEITFNATVDKEIKSVDDFIKSHGVDLEKFDINYANVTVRDTKDGQRHTVSVKLKPKVVTTVQPSVDDILKKYFKENPSPQIYDKNVCESNGDSFLNVYLADLHFGAMPTDECLYENVYDKDIIKKRFEYLVSYLNAKKDKNGKYKDLFIINLGDTLDGFNNSTDRGGHFLPQNLSNKNQFEEYFSCMRNFFENIVQSGIAENIHFYSVGDSNHDGDLQYIVNRTVEIWLNATYPKIETRVFKKFMEHYTHNDHTFILTHGKDRKDMKFGFPLHINDKTEIKIGDYIRVNRLQGFVHFIKGDLHQSSNEYGKGFRYRNAMSLVGATDYTAINYGSFYAGFDIDEFDEYGALIDTKLFFRHHFNN